MQADCESKSNDATESKQSGKSNRVQRQAEFNMSGERNC